MLRNLLLLRTPLRTPIDTSARVAACVSPLDSILHRRVLHALCKGSCGRLVVPGPTVAIPATDIPFQGEGVGTTPPRTNEAGPLQRACVQSFAIFLVTVVEKVLNCAQNKFVLQLFSSVKYCQFAGGWVLF